MQFEQFILKQILRRDVQLDTRHFSHSAFVLSQRPDVMEIIREEGQRQGYGDESVQRQLYAISNNLSQLLKLREEPVLMSIELSDFHHLKLGTMVRLRAATSNMQDCSLKLMRLSKDSFIVIESDDWKTFCPCAIYTLIDKDFLSAYPGATFTFRRFGTDMQSTIGQVGALYKLFPSPAEEAIDFGDLREQQPTLFVLHKNAMALLLHDYSQKLSRYINLDKHQMVTAHGETTSTADLTVLVHQLQASVVYGTREDIEHNYLRWLNVFHANGLSVMTLDTLLNLYWQQKKNAYTNNSDIKNG